MVQTETPEKVVIETIKEERPLLLFLGQDAWNIRGEPDPVLKHTLTHLNKEGTGIKGWPSLIKSETLPHDFFQWLAERFRRRVQPDWLKTIFTLPFSAIFTSSLDPSIKDAFSVEGRYPQVILTGEEIPIVVRSRNRTPIYYLFGRAGQDDENSKPPISAQTLRKRRNTHAIPMLNRLAETVTSMGTVVVEGFNPKNDWLQLDDVLAVIDQMPDKHVIWFGWDENHNLPELKEVEDLAEQGKILLTKTKLSSLVAELNATGKLRDPSQYLLGESSDITFANRKFFAPTPEMRIRVESVASIIDDSWTTFLPPLGDDALYVSFRQFHGDAEGARNLVEGIRRKLAIKRDFEKELFKKVLNASLEHEKYNDPIVLHGQSGTGKSIALSRLVLFLKEKGDVAILYSVSRIPQSTDLSDFCELAENSGASSTVVICDCNAHISRYRELLHQLKSRGRKIVVVGSCYRQIDKALASNKELIEAPTSLSGSERSDLATLLNQFGAVTSSDKISGSSNVLAALYRVLPASRAKFIQGLGCEAQVAEGDIRERGKIRKKQMGHSNLAEQLIAAGLANGQNTLLDQCIDDALENIDDSAGKLIDYVMVPGRINCSVPINLLIRAVSTNSEKIDLNTIARMFSGIDLFRWRRSDQEGEDFLISPRIQLEAALICRRRLVNPLVQGERLVALIEAARLSWDAGGAERRFLIDLIQKFGPDGPEGNYFKNSYLDAARALTNLRQRFSILDPSLMLQESALRRAAIRLNTIEESEQSTILDEARDSIQSAIEHLNKNRYSGSQRTMNNLLVERASIYGFLASNCLKRVCSNDEIWSAYTAARTVAQAAANSISTYYPLDISLWVPADLLDSDALSEQQKIDLRADIHSVLDRIDKDNLEYEQKNQFEIRRLKLGELLKIPNLSDEAFAELDNIGSTAGFFLRARSYGPEVGYNASDDITDNDIEKAKAAVSFLIKNWEKINSDLRCLRYLLQCKWIATTKHYLFRGERQSLPFDNETRRSILEIVQALIATTGDNCDYAFKYLEAVFTWLLGDEGQAKQQWQTLSRETDNNDPRRIYKHHIFTKSDGYPQIFSGRVEREHAQGRWSVNVDELNRRIFMRQADFPEVELAYGRSVSNFTIGFNYIGPIADSLKHIRR
ncbi:hypothetical protein SAMN02746065_103117 [Desulfocicer vacuolatum DSM 3385]|uniref:Novel STAND NTPase 5 domain-containing protein n=1 Tax=Desulfocicer vacuolatum DSM 3385 TaxID=1121400 RepID=A0A1W1ZSC6_9BACT|nr:ATP-binding protein [Desulfocicer vacuolatum]SMC50951.1 hypothetical protein SAMN02746065_103117 [Desulfocicer vacuolatum DSM 3385]